MKQTLQIIYLCPNVQQCQGENIVASLNRHPDNVRRIVESNLAYFRVSQNKTFLSHPSFSENRQRPGALHYAYRLHNLFSLLGLVRPLHKDRSGSARCQTIFPQKSVNLPASSSEKQSHRYSHSSAIS